MLESLKSSEVEHAQEETRGPKVEHDEVMRTLSITIGREVVHEGPQDGMLTRMDKSVEENGTPD